MTEISIIMPLYNAGKYLPETLQSIRKQTYREFEIICINDGSTDNTMDILEQFCIADKRIRIISNQNRSGAAFSRNKGIHEAKGKYVTFLDGDDIFDEEMLSMAYKTIERMKADIVMYEYKHVPSKHVYEKKYMFRGSRYIEKYCKNPFSLKECEPIEFMNCASSPCNKLYRKSLILSNQLEFQTLSCSNDVYFVDMALLLAQKIIMLEDRRVMVYARDHDEPTRISYDRDPMCTYYAVEKIGKELVARGIFDELFQHYYYRSFFHLRAAILKTKKLETAQSFYHFLQKEGIANLSALSKECYQRTDSYIQNMFENFYNLDFETKWFKKENTLSYYLNKNFEKVKALFQSYTSRNISIVIWGVGENGKVLLDFLQDHKLKATDVVDRDEKKYGKIINGYQVKKPEEVLSKNQVIIISTYVIYKEVKRELKGKDIEMIEIGEVVEKN